MNRKNFIGHLALALTLVMVAAFAGQVRRWQREWKQNQTQTRGVLTADPPYRETEVRVRREVAEVLVRFRPGTDVEAMDLIATEHHDLVQDEIESVNGLAVIQDEDGLTAEEVAAEYRSLSEVEYAEPNYRISLEPVFAGGNLHYPSSAVLDESLSEELNDPMFSDQWSLENTGQRGGKAKADINARLAWEKSTGSRKVVVAVLDSGVDYTHLDLINNMWVRPPEVAEYTDDELGTIDDQHGYNAVDNSGDPMDDNGHGTHCAGIIGAEGGNNLGIAGVNWKVEIMPLKFMSAGGFGTTKDAIEAINYVIERKREGVNVRIISASWGSTQKSKALEDAIRTAGDEGILFIAAAGNASTDNDKRPHYPASYELDNVISVAALNRQDELASFSNYGAKSVHIAAPGAEILSTWLNGAFEEHSGTSMATPEVSGVAALVLSVNPKLSLKDLRERLFDSVDKLDTLEGKVSTGGRINAARAVGKL